MGTRAYARFPARHAEPETRTVFIVLYCTFRSFSASHRPAQLASGLVQHGSQAFVYPNYWLDLVGEGSLLDVLSHVTQYSLDPFCSGRLWLSGA